LGGRDFKLIDYSGFLENKTGISLAFRDWFS